MLGQAESGWPDRSQAIRYLIAAALSAVAELITSVVANTIRLPKQVYVLVLLAIVAVAIKAIEKYVDGSLSDLPKNPSSRTPEPSVPGNATMLSGRRISIRTSPSAIFGTLCLVAAFFFYLYAIAFLFSASDNQSFGQGPATAVPALSSILAAIAVALTVFGLFMTVGVRTRMIFSADGIFIRDYHGKLSIRWNEVNNMRITPIWGMPWLVAEVPPGSRLLFLRQWISQRGPQNTIKVCNLSGTGIKSRSVDAALDYWSPFNRSR
jgi:hypothetical protein